MDFELGSEQKQFRDAVLGFAERHLREGAHARAHAPEFPWDVSRRMAEQGLLGITIPSEDGGQGGSLLDAVIAIQAVASVCPRSADVVQMGNFGPIRIGSAKRSLSCFVMVLSWSRGVFARFALDQTQESFLRGHVAAFAAFGGVPRGILYDNLKSVVMERVGDHIRFHPRVLEFAGHYHYAPRPCAPYRGNEKGKVERTIHYLRYSFFEARRFSSVDDLNAQLAAWIEETANTRKVPGDSSGRLVRDALEEERARLLPLPEHAFNCDAITAVASGKTPYVRFDRNDYSIPHDLVRKPLTLVASDRLIRILERLLARMVDTPRAVLRICRHCDWDACRNAVIEPCPVAIAQSERRTSSRRT
jgi:hypothetical protein